MANPFIDKNPYEDNYRDRDVLSVFRKTPKKKTEIEPGMSPEEIVEIVTDRLMDIIREQFQAAKKQFQEKQS
jgi:hypothetical protein